jgi:hypothetical protein
VELRDTPLLHCSTKGSYCSIDIAVRGPGTDPLSPTPSDSRTGSTPKRRIISPFAESTDSVSAPIANTTPATQGSAERAESVKKVQILNGVSTLSSRKTNSSTKMLNGIQGDNVEEGGEHQPQAPRPFADRELSSISSFLKLVGSEKGYEGYGGLTKQESWKKTKRNMQSSKRGGPAGAGSQASFGCCVVS